MHIAEFQAQGLTVISTDAKKAIGWRDTEVFDRDVGNRHSAWEWTGNNVASYSDTMMTGLPSESLVADHRSLFSSADFERFFESGLGCPITVANVRLVKSLPHSGDGFGPQQFHTDGCPAGVLRESIR